MEQGWDPDVKRLFLKVLNSITMGLIWILAFAIAGIYFHLAYTEPGKPVFYSVLYYFALVITLLLLIRYYYRLWRDD